MTNVNLAIGGRTYTVACADGEEAHVSQLGQVIDGALYSMPNAVAHSETRSLLFAALLLADELHDLRAASGTAAPGGGNHPTGSAVPAEVLNALASRLERLADLIEQQTPPNPA